MRCLQPQRTRVPPGDWFCAQCAAHRRKSAEWHASERDAREQGVGGRKPKQRNGYLLDLHGNITGACYACRVSIPQCTASGCSKSRYLDLNPNPDSDPKVNEDAKRAGATTQQRGARPREAHVSCPTASRVRTS